MDKVSRLLAHRIEVLRLSQEIGQQTKAALDERQREVLLREQMAAIQRQLGEGEEGKAAEMAELGEAIAKAEMPKEVEEQARKELRRLRAHAGSRRRIRHGAHLSRLADRAAVGAARGDSRSTSPRRGASSTRTTTVSTRSSGASSSISRCASSRRRARRRSCASSARRASARPRSASRSRAPWTASSCASASAACTTRPRSAATGAPISARCPATSSRRSARPARATA